MVNKRKNECICGRKPGDVLTCLAVLSTRSSKKFAVVHYHFPPSIEKDDLCLDASSLEELSEKLTQTNYLWAAKQIISDEYRIHNLPQPTVIMKKNYGLGAGPMPQNVYDRVKRMLEQKLKKLFDYQTSI